METNRIKICPNYGIVKVCCVYLLITIRVDFITKQGNFFVTNRGKSLITNRGTFLLYIVANLLQIGRIVKNRGKFITNRDSFTYGATITNWCITDA